MSNIQLLGISGSLRKDATNRMLVRNAARVLGGAELVEADLRLPLFDADLQDAEGIPPVVRRLADQIATADAVIVSTPEYNKNLSGVLKNALDWVSRVDGNPWRDKPVALTAAAAGRSGGERALNSLTLAMMPFRARLIVGPDVLVADTRNQFDADGRLINARYEKSLGLLMDRLRAAVWEANSAPIDAGMRA